MGWACSRAIKKRWGNLRHLRHLRHCRWRGQRKGGSRMNLASSQGRKQGRKTPFATLGFPPMKRVARDDRDAKFPTRSKWRVPGWHGAAILVLAAASCRRAWSATWNWPWVPGRRFLAKLPKPSGRRRERDLPHAGRAAAGVACSQPGHCGSASRPGKITRTGRSTGVPKAFRLARGRQLVRLLSFLHASRAAAGVALAVNVFTRPLRRSPSPSPASPPVQQERHSANKSGCGRSCVPSPMTWIASSGCANKAPRRAGLRPYSPT